MAFERACEETRRIEFVLWQSPEPVKSPVDMIMRAAGECG